MSEAERSSEIANLFELSPDYPGVYILGCFGRYITLYSQQVRALNLAYALHKTHRVTRQSRVAVVGAGASGLTATVAIARLGASVTLLEKLPHVMGLQKASTQRFLHPHIYDWPRFEKDGEATGLPFFDWTANFAGEVVAQIEREWNRELKTQSDKITAHLGVTDVAIETPNSSAEALEQCLTITWNDPESGPMEGEFDIVILAVGFGLEPNKDGSQNSYWDNDRLDRIDANKKICLVSGYGDGGLTDLMRLCIRDFRHDRIVRLFAYDPKSRAIGDELLKQELLHRGKTDRKLSNYYEELKVEHVLSLLKKELRTDTDVYLSGRHLWEVFGSRSSILNRFIVSQLRHLKAWKWLQGPLVLPLLRTTDNKYLVRLGEKGARERIFDLVVIRHGPESAILSGFPDFQEPARQLAARWKALPQHQDPTRIRLGSWEDLFAPDERIELTPQHRTEPYRLVVFDADGTLLRGNRFKWSWKLVWGFLKYDDRVRKKLMTEYVNEKKHTHKDWYKEWCDRSAALFRQRKLKRSDFPAITAELTPVEGFRETIDTLKRNNVKIAIVSGGIDVFLEEKIPDYRDLFDNNVYINKFEFNDQGFFTGVNATPYDFEGKWLAIQELCKREGLSPDQVAFVGDGFNDEHVIGKVGLTIGFVPTGAQMGDNADFIIEEPDLRLILPYILNTAVPLPVQLTAKNASPSIE